MAGRVAAAKSTGVAAAMSGEACSASMVGNAAMGAAGPYSTSAIVAAVPAAAYSYGDSIGGATVIGTVIAAHYNGAAVEIGLAPSPTAAIVAAARIAVAITAITAASMAAACVTATGATAASETAAAAGVRMTAASTTVLGRGRADKADDQANQTK